MYTNIVITIMAKEKTTTVRVRKETHSKLIKRLDKTNEAVVDFVSEAIEFKLKKKEARMKK